MKHFVLFIIGLIFSITPLCAQSLSTGKRYYRAHEYKKAKPIMKRYAKRYPRNGTYNYWYGVCCYKTGEQEIAEKHLLIGAEKKISTAFLYLGEYYFNNYRFDESIQAYQNYISLKKKERRRKKETLNFEKYDSIIAKAKIAHRALKGVAKITFIDSISIDKTDFLSAYEISKETGKLFYFNQFFRTAKDTCTGIVYETELKNQMFYSEKSLTNGLDLLSCKRIAEKWGKASPLNQLNTTADENYPFLMSDGITFYYASNGEGSMGGYDIFATRYNSNTNHFLRQQNIGMPFNSTYNDYMYVIDEYLGIGWFATDRYQPEGKVCIYSFIVQENYNYYNYEKDDKQIIRLAAMHPSITSHQNKEVNAAHKRLLDLKTNHPQKEEHNQFTFAIDYDHVYHSLNQFKSNKAQKDFLRWQKENLKLQQNKRHLTNLRIKYHNSSIRKKEQLKKNILQLEKQIIRDHSKLKQLANEVRKTEKTTFKR
jgi:hypothetical protein